jgi:hypothetical protein
MLLYTLYFCGYPQSQSENVNPMITLAIPYWYILFCSTTTVYTRVKVEKCWTNYEQFFPDSTYTQVTKRGNFFWIEEGSRKKGATRGRVEEEGGRLGKELLIKKFY